MVDKYFHLNMRKMQLLKVVFLIYISTVIKAYAQLASNSTIQNPTGGSTSTNPPLGQCYTSSVGGLILSSTTSLPNPTPVRRMLQTLNNSVKTPIQISNKYDEYLSSYKPKDISNKGTPQYDYRNLIFTKNVQKMNMHNSNDKKKYTMGLNQFADLEESQFIKIYSRLTLPTKTVSNVSKTPDPGQNSNISLLTINATTNPGKTPPGQLKKQPLPSTGPIITSNGSVTTNSGPQNIAQAATLQAAPIISGTRPASVSAPNVPLPNPNAAPIVSAPVIPVGTIINYNPTQNVATAGVYTTPLQISIDWSCKASPVINQGLCGSCYIIAPLESIYITLRIYNQSVLPLSIQELVSCGDSANGLYGCSGGYFVSSFQYNRVNGTGRALMYPYNAKAINQGVATACSNSIMTSTAYINSKVKIRQSGYITYGDCASLVQKLKTQALAVSIATQNFQFYVNGTYNVANQTPNHGVTLVGYNPIDGYKIKNSWGSSWGNLGYAYVSQTTGVCDYSMFPVTGFQGLSMGACC